MELSDVVVLEQGVESEGVHEELGAVVSNEESILTSLLPWEGAEPLEDAWVHVGIGGLWLFVLNPVVEVGSYRDSSDKLGGVGDVDSQAIGWVSHFIDGFDGIDGAESQSGGGEGDLHLIFLLLLIILVCLNINEGSE